jgi:hypothetical protein
MKNCLLLNRTEKGKPSAWHYWGVTKAASAAIHFSAFVRAGSYEFGF